MNTQRLAQPPTEREANRVSRQIKDDRKNSTRSVWDSTFGCAEVRVNVVVDTAILLKENYCNDAVTRNLRDHIATLDYVTLSGAVFKGLKNKKIKSKHWNTLSGKLSYHGSRNCSTGRNLSSNNANNKSYAVERNIFSVWNLNSSENEKHGESSMCSYTTGSNHTGNIKARPEITAKIETHPDIFNNKKKHTESNDNKKAHTEHTNSLKTQLKPTDSLKTQLKPTDSLKTQPEPLGNVRTRKEPTGNINISQEATRNGNTNQEATRNGKPNLKQVKPEPTADSGQTKKKVTYPDSNKNTTANSETSDIKPTLMTLNTTTVKKYGNVKQSGVFTQPVKEKATSSNSPSAVEEDTSDYEGSLSGLLSDEEGVIEEAMEPQQYTRLVNSKANEHHDEDLPIITSPRKQRQTTGSDEDLPIITSPRKQRQTTGSDEDIPIITSPRKQRQITAHKDETTQKQTFESSQKYLVSLPARDTHGTKNTKPKDDSSQETSTSPTRSSATKVCGVPNILKLCPVEPNNTNDLKSSKSEKISNDEHSSIASEIIQVAKSIQKVTNELQKIASPTKSQLSKDSFADNISSLEDKNTDNHTHEIQNGPGNNTDEVCIGTENSNESLGNKPQLPRTNVANVLSDINSNDESTAHQIKLEKPMDSQFTKGNIGRTDEMSGKQTFQQRCKRIYENNSRQSVKDERVDEKNGDNNRKLESGSDPKYSVKEDKRSDEKSHKAYGRHQVLSRHDHRNRFYICKKLERDRNDPQHNRKEKHNGIGNIEWRRRYHYERRHNNYFFNYNVQYKQWSGLKRHHKPSLYELKHFKNFYLHRKNEIKPSIYTNKKKSKTQSHAMFTVNEPDLSKVNSNSEDIHGNQQHQSVLKLSSETEIKRYQQADSKIREATEFAHAIDKLLLEEKRNSIKASNTYILNNNIIKDASNENKEKHVESSSVISNHNNKISSGDENKQAIRFADLDLNNKTSDDDTSYVVKSQYSKTNETSPSIPENPQSNIVVCTDRKTIDDDTVSEVNTEAQILEEKVENSLLNDEAKTNQCINDEAKTNQCINDEAKTNQCINDEAKTSQCINAQHTETTEHQNQKDYHKLSDKSINTNETKENMAKKRKVELMNNTCTISSVAKCSKLDESRTLLNLSTEKCMKARNYSNNKATTAPNPEKITHKCMDAGTNSKEDKPGYSSKCNIGKRYVSKQRDSQVIKSKVVDVSKNKRTNDNKLKERKFGRTNATTSRRQEVEIIDLTKEISTENESIKNKKVNNGIKRKSRFCYNGKDRRDSTRNLQRSYKCDHYRQTNDLDRKYDNFRSNRGDSIEMRYNDHQSPCNTFKPSLLPLPRTAYEKCFNAIQYGALDSLRKFYDLYPRVYKISQDEFRCKLQNGLRRNCDRYFYEADDPIYSHMGPQPRFSSEDIMVQCIAQTVISPDIFTDVDLHANRHYYKQYREFEVVVGRVGYNIECHWCQVDFCDGQFIRALPVLEPIGHRYDTMYCQ